MSEYKTLDIDAIETARKDQIIGQKVVVFQSTGSTNDIAWEYAGRIYNDGLCVLAESQTKGRGRRGRKWQSLPGQSVLCSILLLKQSIEAEMLTLAAAVAAAEAIRHLYHIRCLIKWPNDLLLENKKLAGILVEKRTVKTKDQFVVGIGINCSQQPEDFKRLNTPATSLKMHIGKDIDRTELVCAFMKSFELWLTKPVDKIIKKWLELSGMLGRRLTVECDGKQFSGTCLGIDPANGLILQLDRGPVQFFPAYQTSVIESILVH